MMEIKKIIGLLLQWHDEKGSEPRWVEVKKAVLGYLKDFYTKQPCKEGPMIVIELPCGHTYTIETCIDLLLLPAKDIPCTCGDPKHWIIKFVKYTK